MTQSTKIISKIKMFRKIGNLKQKKILDQPTIVNKKNLGNKSVMCTSNYIIFKDKKNYQVFDRKCDHAGGKIISKNSKHICPMHNWEFLPKKGKYKNGVIKKPVTFIETEKSLEIQNEKIFPNITKINPDKKRKVQIRFFNHAFLMIKTNEFKFATDPWAVGPAFNNGWWLQKKTKSDWLKEINNVDFIYLSHNHPDHLHEETLSLINKDIPIIVPNFRHDSVGKYIETLGFKKIIRLEFLKEYRFKNTDLILSFLKSGDFREDSGIYLSINNFTILIDVDSNEINFGRFPNVDLYCSSFAGGASGYPLMFDNFDLNQKKEIIEKKIAFLKQKKFKNLLAIKPKYFLPYASFFSEKLKRDDEILLNNKKNQIEDYNLFCKKQKIDLLNVKKKDEFTFFDNKIVKKNIKASFFNEAKPETYLKKFKKDFEDININEISNYFENSNFKDDLILYISLVNDNFKKSYLNFSVDFSKNKIGFKKLKKFKAHKLKENEQKRILFMKIRKESFINTIRNFNPWEDLSIGFQCKIVRYPNIYNVNFWDHFTNKYIRGFKLKYYNNCNQCERIIQNLDKEIKNKEFHYASKNF